MKPRKEFLRTILAFYSALQICIPMGAKSLETGPKVGDAPPALEFSTIIQGPSPAAITWQKLKGKVVVLEFWNTACVPCVAAIPHLNQLADQFANKPVIFLGISDDNPNYLKKFLNRTAIKGWQVIDGPLRPTATAYSVVGIPHTVLVDPSGRIAAITRAPDIEPRHIEELLAGKPSTLTPNTKPAESTPVKTFLEAVPTNVSVTIEGPFPKPDQGAYGSYGWSSNYLFKAEKTSPAEILTSFFHVSGKCVPRSNLPTGLYNVTAAAPPDHTNALQTAFLKAVQEKWFLQVQPINREISVYILTVGSTNAPGLKPAKIIAGSGQKAGGFRIGGQPIRYVAFWLERSLDRPVIDETNLQGIWTADVRWEMTEAELNENEDAMADPAKVMEAVRAQLGLELRETFRFCPVLEIRTAHHRQTEVTPKRNILR